MPVMTDQLVYDRLRTGEDDRAVEAMLRQAFAITAAQAAREQAQAGRERYRVVRGAHGPVATLNRIEGMAHWFGGRPVDCVGIAGVAVDPAARGQGVGRAMMRACLTEISDAGGTLSSLYGATVPVYAGVGYGAAGDAIVYQAPTAMFAAGRGGRAGIARMPVPDRTLLAGLRRREAARGNGLVEREDLLWNAVHEPGGAETDTYLFDGPQGPEGYAVLCRRPDGVVEFTDVCALTADAARAAIALAGGYRAQARQVVWTGGQEDLLVLLAPDPAEVGVRRWRRWLLRIVDVERALAARGYPGGPEAELVLHVDDPLLPRNAGPWRLTVAAGRGHAERPARGAGGKGIALGIGALATLYAGHVSPEGLRAAGLLEADDRAVAVATRIFAGPRPWSVDRY